MTAKNDDYFHLGLTDQEVLQSREKYGANLLTPPKRPSLLKLYLEKFEDPVVRVLLIAAVFSLIISVIENEYAETIGIIAAILLATGIGFYFEYDANKKFDLLNAVTEETLVKVIRNGRIQEIPRKDVVVGDIVVLETGEEIPADGELIEAISLQVNESNLTGEPVINKTIIEADFDEEATYASNLVMRGTTVVDGHGSMKVLRVGDATEIGKVARQSTEQTTEPTPLNIQLTKLANLIGKIGFTVAGLAFLIFFIKDVVLYFDFGALNGWHDWLPVLERTLKYFMMAVTLIVVAVPEGLPMSVTLSLALNMRRMLATNNLVRKMHACETMGAITVICTDKTGTLTQNLMQVHEPNFYGLKDGGKLADDDISRLIAEGISANSTAFLEETGEGEKPKGVGNPTEVALLLWLNSQKRNYLELREGARVLDQLTFSTERKFMATLVKSPLIGKKVLYIKGAPEIVLGKCKKVILDGRRVDSVEYRSTVEAQLLGYQNMAMRTLGFAFRLVEDNEPDDCVALVSENNLNFLGVVAISDPIRPDVPAAVAKCQSAGIGIKIVTGDTPGTATEIARQIGLWKPEDTERNRITGVAFAELSDEEALDRVMDLKIMSRARPTDKQRLVQLLQQKGAVVAVTGDGTNDAPALNHAQVGLSMGTGTSVAKEASDITLLDDSFNSIGTAVMWGRSLYKNIQRFIVFQLTINFVALLIVLLGSIVGTELPLTVTQMLWVNLIMDTFAALALASIPPSESVMNDKPRRSTDFIISKAMQHNIFGVGTLFLVVLMAMIYYFTNADGGMTVQRLTIFFTFFVMLQFWNLFNARVFGTTDSAFKGLTKSYGMELIVLAILGGQFLIVQFGGAVFRTEPLDWQTWLIIIGSSSLVLWIGELIRLVKRLTQK
ncbi:calcium-translocating P-type ATPase, PMCA-type [Bacteroides fragilis str. S23 R14]|uniref:calcium-translocating P-type ATPase, PMCA-type n=1 Tax=Bacteroides fragilis TaxID=817 RepID=UPI000445BCC4|nr:calcium-translocating P-type ATPase, PMCA-type [Bacteroides fragilis]EXZ98141.1 calcium-translocating P-type ATPase, PMCA-type [Bacteroides fragilis str. S23 R14]EXZ98399.1 calcium-translocating P-type ATPase, PMCA-type [Bacteroides fragilis str. S23 R14]EYA64347.1 calcium-translocating P-type ATPase, PMCA-type [Bacteroides fragilis str. S23L24]EYE41668.1 calcium-translocating P-type ATPase, PMCA-type [Bacteroides fragilis str. S23L17]MCS2586174.1 calcium-translocating P-type ATPase, PMCA-t